MALLGTQLRELGLLQLRAILERSGAELSPGQLEKIARVFLAHPPEAREPIAEAARRDIALLLKSTRERVPENHALDLDVARQELFDALEPLAEAKPFNKKAKVLESYPFRVRGAMDIYPPLRSFPIPNVADAAAREVHADALETVVLALALTLGANLQFEGAATPEQIASYAGPLNARLVDPYTGEAPRIENSEENGVLAALAGPDAKFAQAPVWEYKRGDEALAGGDIIARLPWNDWHDRHRRGRALQSDASVQTGSRPF
jgi:hypothetical protein